jgi:A/G-specific adenine glycosylase
MSIKSTEYIVQAEKQKEDNIPQKSSDKLGEIPAPLLDWYDAHARILPWRESASPYRVWVSEIMLQQTRVEAVKPYFERFMAALPTVQTLAEVEEEALLKLWEGLGYYNRARNLQKAAQIVVGEYEGEIPSSYEELVKLPGIGSYTAGAVSSIAYGKPVPAVDGNVLRVISRVTADRQDIMKQSVKVEMEQRLQSIMPKERPGAFNQALMEIGAMVCVPNGVAKCDECPLNTICEAKKQDIVMELPYKSPKKPRTTEDKTVLLIKKGDKVAVRKRKGTGLLAGLYEFPNTEGRLTEDEVLKLMKQMAFAPIRIQKLEDSKHIFTHREWHMTGYAVRIDELDNQPEEYSDDVDAKQDYIFINPEETKEKYPIPTAFRAYTKHMNIKLGNENFEN